VSEGHDEAAEQPLQRRGRRVIVNAGFLTALLMLDYLAPLIVLPVLAHVLEHEAGMFSAVAFSMALVQVAVIFTQYGFQFSATQDISIHRDDKAYIAETIGAIYVIQTALFLVVALGIVLFALNSTQYAEHKVLLILCLLPVFGQSFQPIWLFLGIEKMKLVTLSGGFAKSTYILLVLLWVRSPADYIWVPVANGVGQMLAFIVGVWLIYREGLTIKRPSWARVIGLAKMSFSFFLSRVSVAAYTSGSAVLLGIFGVASEVGIFLVAEQLYKGITALFNPIRSAAYPYMAREQDFRFFYRLIAVLTLVGVVGAGVAYWLGPVVIERLFGPQLLGATPIFNVFLLVVLVNVPAGLLGYVYMGAYHRAHWANYTVIAGCTLHLIALTIAGSLGPLDASIIVRLVLMTECGVFVARLLLCVWLARHQSLPQVGSAN
jgi:PST family polysaccharide transporter